MKKKIKLTENQFHTLNFLLRMEMLTEEKSISDDVGETSKNIIKYILEELPKSKKVKVNNHNEFSGSFRMMLFDRGIYSIRFKCYSVRYENFNSSEYNLFSSADITNRELIINFLRVDGQIDKRTLDDAVCHEVEHIYQSIMKSTSIIYDKNIYDIAINTLQNSSSSEEEINIARIIYLSQYSEQDAMVHGLYNWLIASENEMGFSEAFTNSDAYGQLSFLHSMNDVLNKEHANTASKYQQLLIEVYKRDLDWLNRVLFKTLKRFNNKIGHVVQRYKNEKKYPKRK